MQLLPRNTAKAVVVSAEEASRFPHAREQYESPSPDAAAVRRIPLSLWVRFPRRDRRPSAASIG